MLQNQQAKKGEFFTAHENYSDDGQMKTFTHINHDLKTSINVSSDKEEFDHSQYRKEVVDEILLHSASYCPMDWIDFTIRGEDVAGIIWNESMLREEGNDITSLMFLKNILTNRQELLRKNL